VSKLEKLYLDQFYEPDDSGPLLAKFGQALNAVIDRINSLEAKYEEHHHLTLGKGPIRDTTTPVSPIQEQEEQE